MNDIGKEFLEKVLNNTYYTYKMRFGDIREEFLYNGFVVYDKDTSLKITESGKRVLRQIQREENIDKILNKKEG